jgi:2,4-dienoyl-CoA reductase (NADPH2)
VGDRVAILGGNAVGLETALYLAGLGTLTPEVLHFLMINGAESVDTLNVLLRKGIKSVTVVEMTRKAGADIGLTTKWTIMGELKRLGVKIMTETEAVGITPESLEIQGKGIGTRIEADTIVLAAGSRAVNGLLRDIEPLALEVHVIGDAKDPRDALTAIQEGFEVGVAL